MILSYPAGEEQIVFELPKALRHEIQALLQEDRSGNDADKSLCEGVVEELMLEPERRIAQETTDFQYEQLKAYKTSACRSYV